MPEFERKAKRVSAWQYQSPPADTPEGITQEQPGWLVERINGGQITVAHHHRDGWFLSIRNPDPAQPPATIVNGMWILLDAEGAIAILDDATFRDSYEMV